MLKKVLTGLALFVIVFAASYALLHPGFFFAHDFVHAARISEMLRALQEGQFPVRWSANFGYGYGMPLFEFYAPLPYYVGALFYWLGLGIIPSIKLLFLLSSLGAAVGAYYLGKNLHGRTAGILLAAMYTLAPYRAVNLFVRGSLSETWAMMGIPWVLLGILRVQRRQAHGWQILLSGLVIVFLSHNITSMFLVPVAAIWTIGLWLSQIWRERQAAVPTWQPLWSQIKPWMVLLATGVLAVGLTAFYTVPALAEKDQTQIARILGGYFDYRLHFLYLRQFFKPFWGYGGSEFGPNDGISFYLGTGQLLGVVLAVASLGAYLWRRVKGRAASAVSTARSRQPRFKSLSLGNFSPTLVMIVANVLVVLLAMYLTLEKSAWIWQRLSFLQIAQFPWRWLSMISLFVGLLVVNGLSLLSSQWRRITLSVLVIAVIVIGNAGYFHAEKYLDHPDDLYYTDPIRIQTEMSGILPDYIPAQMPEKLIPPTTKFLVPDGYQDHITPLVERGTQRLYQTDFSNKGFINFMIADFPGWKIEIDGQPTEKSFGQNGTFKVEVPAGKHLVGAYFGESPVRGISDKISSISLLLLIGLLVKLQLPSSLLTAKIARSSSTTTTASSTKAKKRK
jgi:hypothetical protein